MKDQLLEEFTDLYKNPNENIPLDADAIIILTGNRPPMQDENISRIKYTKAILKKLDKNIPVVFSGVTEERESVMNLMIDLGIPKKFSHFQDCGKIGIANTKTQFETLTKDPFTKDFKNLIIVTSTYHIPRTKRTASNFFRAENQFVVAGDPEDWKMYNSFLLVMDEIKKIIEYSEKGDISENP